MKFFNILKEYNNAIIKENKRLNSIYKSLLRECGDDLDDLPDTEAIDDCDVSEKDDDASLKNCDDSSCNEENFDEMLEASRKDKSSKDTEDDTPDNDLLVASEFFKECDDEDAATNEVEDLNDSGTAEYDEVARFFAEDDEDDEDDEEVDAQKKKSSDEELMSAEEFFAEDDKDAEDDEDDEVNEDDEDDKEDDDLKENTDSKKSSSDDLMTAEEFFDTANEAEDDETNEDSLISKDKVINGSSKNDKKCDETEKKLISAMDIFKSSPANEAEEDQKGDDDTVKTEPKEELAKEEPVKKEPAKEESTKDQSDEKDAALKESLREYRRNNAHLFID